MMFRKLKHLAILLGLLTASIAFNGCAKNIVIYPITGEDIFTHSEAGKNWVCMSEFYVHEVMKARMGQ